MTEFYERLRTGLLLGWLVLNLLAVGSTRAALQVGPNLNTTKSTGNNAETTIAINPLNAANLFVSDTWSVVGRYTTNGGTTWLTSNLSALGSSIGDVSAAWDAFGNLFLVRFGSSQRVVVGLSTNGGASFSVLYTTTSTQNDQSTVTVGPSATPGQGSVWITYTDSHGNLVVQGAAVTARGQVGSFSAAQTAPGPGGDFGDIAIGPNGQVMVVYQDSNSGEGPDTLMINLDPDGLGSAGFGPALAATGTQVGGFASIPAQPIRSIDAEAGLAWDRSGGLHNGRVYLMYTDRPSTNSADTDIYVRYSDDNGTNWSARVRVNDDTVGNGKSQFLPKIALDQTTGNIAVSFYDCRNSAANNTAELWAAVSTNGGVSFSANVKVSGGVSSALVSAIHSTSFDFGDYTGLAFNAGAFYPCWADNSNSTGDNPAGANGNFDMYTARIILGDAPVIATLQPSNQIVAQSQPATFTVTASGSSPLGFQWRFSGAPISGAMGSAYSLINAQCINVGSYDVVVSNLAGSVTSAVVALSVIAPPVILAPPTNLAVVVGQPASFQVTATNDCGNGLIYQWTYSATNLPDRTNTMLVLPDAQLADAGSYAVVVTNLAGAVTSTVAVLTVQLPPQLAVSPAYLDFGVVVTGATAAASFIVSNAGEAQLSGSATISGGPFDFTGASNGQFMVPGRTATNVFIVFSPLISGAYSNAVVFASNGGNTTNSLLGLAVDTIAPTILSPALVGGNFIFSFQTIPTKSYVVQHADDLGAAPWLTLQTVPGDGNLKTISVPANSPHQFYRLAVE